MNELSAYEEGTDNEFRNVGKKNSDAGELPTKEQITYSLRTSVHFQCQNRKDRISHYYTDVI